MNKIDTHFHLDLFDNASKLVLDIEKSKTYTIAVTNSPSVFKFSHDLTKDKKYIKAALGLHPELAYQRAGEMTLFQKYIKLTRYIGEIGLDFSNRNISSKNIQIQTFEKIIQLCTDEKNKILTIHSRKAEKEVIEIIGKNFPGKVILHWYSGSLKNLKKALDFGFYFSINYQMLKSKNGNKIISSIPENRILTESDGPFIEINNRKNSPLLINLTYQGLEQVLKKQDVQNLVYNNFREVLT